MRRVALALGLVVAAAGPSIAGHGMSAAFASIEWLPDPGRTPDELLYALDGWAERRELAAATTSRETLGAALRIAREKLAELEAMVAKGDASAAAVARDRYASAIAEAGTAVSRGEEKEVAALARDLCQALLEHQYILSVDYETLPAGTRAIVADVVADAERAYREVAPLLVRADRDAFFFKEGEVRWSVRAGIRDDGGLERSIPDR